MKVREHIAVSRPANGGLDVPLVFELEDKENLAVLDYLGRYLGDGCMEVRHAAWRLAERGMPQAIATLVEHELTRQHRFVDAAKVEAFPPCRSFDGT
jgi:hypothetical protein